MCIPNVCLRERQIFCIVVYHLHERVHAQRVVKAPQRESPLAARLAVSTSPPALTPARHPSDTRGCGRDCLAGALRRGGISCAAWCRGSAGVRLAAASAVAANGRACASPLRGTQPCLPRSHLPSGGQVREADGAPGGQREGKLRAARLRPGHHAVEEGVRRARAGDRVQARVHLLEPRQTCMRRYSLMLRSRSCRLLMRGMLWGCRIL